MQQILSQDSKYHSPRVLIVVTHFNYSKYVEDALVSVRNQDYENFRCIVVDDCSSEDHYGVLAERVRKIGDSRFSLLRNRENIGQIHSVYRAINEADAGFTAILDPDDRYCPNFISSMLAAHLNPRIFCPLVSCDQYLMRLGDGILTGTQRVSGWNPEIMKREEENFRRYGFHRYILPLENSWHWSTTSSMFFRTDALKAIEPRRRLPYKVAADAYCANGAHMLGGTILLNVPLVYRGLHQDNDFANDRIYSIFQRQHKAGAVFLSDALKVEAMRSFFENGSDANFGADDIAQVIVSQFTEKEIAQLTNSIPRIAELDLGSASKLMAENTISGI